MGFHGAWAHLGRGAVRSRFREEKDFPAEFPAERFFEEDRVGSAIDDHKFGERHRAASSGKEGRAFSSTGTNFTNNINPLTGKIK